MAAVSVLHFICETLSEGGGSSKGVFTQYPKPEGRSQSPAVVDLIALKLDERQALRKAFPSLLRSSLNSRDFREQIHVFKQLPWPSPPSLPSCCSHPKTWSPIWTTVSGKQSSFPFCFLPASNPLMATQAYVLYLLKLLYCRGKTSTAKQNMYGFELCSAELCISNKLNLSFVIYKMYLNYASYNYYEDQLTKS